MALITFATLIGNVSVIAALLRAKRSPTHYPLSSLVVADFMVGLVVLPIATARELFVFHLPRAVCVFWSTMDVLCCTASILSLCVLGWERWCGITAPLARARRAKKARLLACIVWPVASAVALPTAFIPSPRHFHPGEMAKACTVNTNIGYVFFSISFSFYLPAGMMLVMYGYILRALAAPPPIRVHRGRSPNQETQNQAQRRSREATDASDHAPKDDKKADVAPTGGLMTRQRRATRTIIMLMALFLVCWAPFFIMLPLDSVFDCVWDSAWQWCTWLGYLNSALNPLVYSAGSPTVRKALRASFTTNSSSRNTLPIAFCVQAPPTDV